MMILKDIYAYTSMSLHYNFSRKKEAFRAPAIFVGPLTQSGRDLSTIAMNDELPAWIDSTQQIAENPLDFIATDTTTALIVKDSQDSLFLVAQDGKWSDSLIVIDSLFLIDGDWYGYDEEEQYWKKLEEESDSLGYQELIQQTNWLARQDSINGVTEIPPPDSSMQDVAISESISTLIELSKDSSIVLTKQVVSTDTILLKDSSQSLHYDTKPTQRTDTLEMAQAGQDASEQTGVVGDKTYLAFLVQLQQRQARQDSINQALLHYLQYNDNVPAKESSISQRPSTPATPASNSDTDSKSEINDLKIQIQQLNQSLEELRNQLHDQAANKSEKVTTIVPAPIKIESKEVVVDTTRTNALERELARLSYSLDSIQSQNQGDSTANIPTIDSTRQQLRDQLYIVQQQLAIERKLRLDAEAVARQGSRAKAATSPGGTP